MSRSGELSPLNPRLTCHQRIPTWKSLDILLTNGFGLFGQNNWKFRQVFLENAGLEKDPQRPLNSSLRSTQISQFSTGEMAIRRRALRGSVVQFAEIWIKNTVFAAKTAQGSCLTPHPFEPYNQS